MSAPKSFFARPPAPTFFTDASKNTVRSPRPPAPEPEALWDAYADDAPIPFDPMPASHILPSAVSGPQMVSDVWALSQT